MNDPVDEMDRCVAALQLELPDSVWRDVRRIWGNVRGFAKAGQGEEGDGVHR